MAVQQAFVEEIDSNELEFLEVCFYFSVIMIISLNAVLFCWVGLGVPLHIGVIPEGLILRWGLWGLQEILS